MNRIALSAMLLAVSTAAMAQDEVETTVEADVVNQYIWRGQDLGNVSLQPTLGIGYNGLALSAWGSVGLAEASDTKEFDLTAAYTVGGLTVSLTDYWFNTGLDAQNRYFMYDSHRTNHVLEASVGYDFGPASVQWYTNLAGNDGVDKDGDRAYSSYVELAAPFALGGASWTATLGLVPFATTSYGTSGLAVTNVAVQATKDVKVTDRFTLPVFAGIAANPCAQKAYLVVGFTLRP